MRTRVLAGNGRRTPAAAEKSAGESSDSSRQAPATFALVQRQVTNGLTSTMTSSMGRLFDAISSISGVCQIAEYEAEAATA